MKEALETLLQKIVEAYSKEAGFSLPSGFQVEVDLSQDRSHGDLTTPVAFRLDKFAKEKPFRIAARLLQLFEKHVGEGKLGRGEFRGEVAGGGFINFFVPSEELGGILIEIHQKDVSFGESPQGQGKKVLIEFVC